MALPIQIVPSVLPADFARLGDEMAALEAAGVDLIQWDVMDGQFVPNLTFGPDVIAAIPFVMSRLGFDPAQSATIFTTTLTDAVGFFTLLGLAALSLGLL